jgi:1-phosphatidylinositol-4-phosphate 5-kinase
MTRSMKKSQVVNKISKLFGTHFEEIIDADNKKYIMIDKDIKVIEFAPDVFAYLRDLDGYNNNSLKESLKPTIEGNVNNMFKAGEGMGRSGSFFFFSHDDRFLIKTMTTDDFKAFIKLLPLYFDHINYFEDSLMARIYGVY